MSTADTVALACQHQEMIVQVLAYMGAIMPVASIVAWLSARWNRMPAGAQAILQLLAGNLLHSLFGEPQPGVLPANPPAPAAPPAPSATPPAASTPQPGASA